MKKKLSIVLLVFLISSIFMGFFALENASAADGFYTNKQLKEQFGIDIFKVIRDYNVDALMVSFDPIYVYISTHSSNNTRENETSMLEMNLKDIVLQTGKATTVHLSGSETVSEGGQWEGKYTIQRSFEADLSLYWDEWDEEPYYEITNVMWTNYMDRFGKESNEPRQETAADKTKSIDLNYEEYGNTDSDLFFAIYLNPVEVPNEKTTAASIRILVTAVKPSADALDALKALSGASSASESESETGQQEQKDFHPVVQIEDDLVSDKQGEETTPIKTAAIIGVAATIAALGAAGAAGAAGSSAGTESAAAQKAPEENARQKTGDFRMVVYKTFGDTIEFEKPGQEVYARIESADPATGMWQYDAQKSMTGITVSLTSAEGLSLGPPSVIPGKGRGVTFIHKNLNPKPDASATLSFRYTAPDGGYFERQMVFKLGCKPEIIIEKKTYLLSTEAHFELPYRLVACGENPEISFSCPSGLVLADLSVGDEENKRFLRISPAQEAVEWDQSAFIKPAKCKLEVKFGSKPEDKISVDLEITLCYEGIGTAFLNTPVNKAPDIITIPCFADNDPREKYAYALPLTVMVWNPDKRLLEPDSAAIKALSMEVRVRVGAKMTANSERYKKAQEMIDNAKIALCATKKTVDTEPTLSPVTFGLQATGKAADDYIDVILTFISDIPQIKTLTLEARTSNDTDYKGMIRWLITYPEGSYVSQFIKLGDVKLYHEALDHLEAVYQYDKLPLKYSYIDMNSVSGGNAFYVPRKDLNEPYIAMRQVPTDIGDLMGISLLYHELTHTLEDIVLDERNVDTSMGSERNGTLVENLAQAANFLCNAEKGINIYGNVRNAIRALSDIVNNEYVRPWLSYTMSTTLGRFNAKYSTLPKEMFYNYATAYSGPNAEEVKKAVRSSFCPMAVPGDHCYTVSDGLFMGGKWYFKVHSGVVNITNVAEFVCTGYAAKVTSYEWIPDKERLFIKLHMTIQKNGSSYVDLIDVILESSEPYQFNETSYVKMPGFKVTWKLSIPPNCKFFDPPKDSLFYLNHEQNSVISLTPE